MSIICKTAAISFDQLDFLKESDTLFVCDFRSTGESFEYEIPAMWKYENILLNLPNKGKSLCNEDFNSIIKNDQQEVIVLKKDKDPKRSIIEKLLNPPDVKRLWTAIPHPKIDQFAQKNNLELNYKFDDFLRYNDKITQKELCSQYTPEWNEINNDKVKINKEYFIKRSIGSGGYCIWQDMKDVNIDNNYRYFREKKVKGLSSSVQIYSEKNENYIFGYSHQFINNETEFYGANILNLKNLPSYCFSDICKTIEVLKKELLSDFNGFWGIDFIDDPHSKKYWFLEANVRVTALTIPSLIKNNSFQRENLLFLEDENNLKKSDYLIAYDGYYKTYDVLRKI
jgi:predicted ATP-grasp superfamily ATP-dependent carboligase